MKLKNVFFYSETLIYRNEIYFNSCFNFFKSNTSFQISTASHMKLTYQEIKLQVKLNDLKKLIIKKNIGTFKLSKKSLQHINIILL